MTVLFRSMLYISITSPPLPFPPPFDLRNRRTELDICFRSRLRWRPRGKTEIVFRPGKFTPPPRREAGPDGTSHISVKSRRRFRHPSICQFYVNTIVLNSRKLFSLRIRRPRDFRVSDSMLFM